MMKMVGAAEFKATCLRLIEEMQTDGESITVTRRGKPVAVMSPPPRESADSLFGCMKDTVTIHGDILGPVDPDWEAEWDAKWRRNNPPELYDPHLDEEKR